jgi:alkylation response protein AidB-like acyl-CoA dehydrogenase
MPPRAILFVPAKKGYIVAAETIANLIANAREGGTIVPAETLRRIKAAGISADRSNSFPFDGLQALHETGLLLATVDRRYGGAGADIIALAEIIAELGRADPSVALIAAMTLFNHLKQAQNPSWPEEYYHRLVNEKRERPILINAARVEPELGSPARGGLPKTLARREAEGWRITGAKHYVSGAGGLSHYLVWAITDENPARVGTFIVEAESPGIRVIENWDNLGMRATATHDVVFENVFVPAQQVINITDSSAAAQDNRDHALLTTTMVAIYLGVAEAARDAFSSFAHSRIPSNLGYAIAQTERIQTIAGEIDLLVSSARTFLFDALQFHRDEPEHLIRSRLIIGRQLLDAVSLAVRSLGAPGLSAEVGLERHFRDIQAVLVHAPQPDTALSLLGRAAFARFRASQPQASADQPRQLRAAG